MENLIKHISNPNKKTINLIKLGNGDIVTSPSKWLSDRWFLRESNFAENLTCIEISPFKNNKDSNTFVGSIRMQTCNQKSICFFQLGKNN